MSPVAGEEASVTTPGGSRPLDTRASHSQPTRLAPIDMVAPAVWVATVVLRQMRSLPSAALTFSGNHVNAFWPTYMPPSSAFSGWLAPVGSRQVPVGIPLGSAPPLCVDL